MNKFVRCLPLILLTATAHGQSSAALKTSSEHVSRSAETNEANRQGCPGTMQNAYLCVISPDVPAGPVWHGASPPNDVLIEDQRFVADEGFLEKGIPGQHAHWALDFHAGENDPYEYQGPCCTGPVGLMINGFAVAGGGLKDQSKANLVSLQVGAIQKSASTRPAWGEDLSAQCAHGSTVLCTALELDLLNEDSREDIHQNSIGFKLISSGKSRPGIGAAITALNPPIDSWQLAGLFANYHQTGIQISNGDAGSNALKIVPPDDTSAPEVVGYSPDLRQISWQVTNDGSASWKDVKANTISGGAYLTSVNCSSSNSHADCKSAPAGSIIISVAASTVVVNTTALSANSQVLITFDESLGARLGVTCNVSHESEAAAYFVSSRLPGKSFTVRTNHPPIGDPACLSYLIEN